MAEIVGSDNLFQGMTAGAEICSPTAELLMAGEQPDQWPIVTICGSMRFYYQMLTVAEELTLDGYVVLMPFVRKEPFMEADVNHPGNVIEKLDAQHKRKIDLATSIVVVSDETGYYGDSTRSEIEYAQLDRKAVTYRRVVLKHTCAERRSNACTACLAARGRECGYESEAGVR